MVIWLYPRLFKSFQIGVPICTLVFPSIPSISHVYCPHRLGSHHGRVPLWSFPLHRSGLAHVVRGGDGESPRSLLETHPTIEDIYIYYIVFFLISYIQYIYISYIHQHCLNIPHVDKLNILRRKFIFRNILAIHSLWPAVITWLETKLPIWDPFLQQQQHDA